MKADGEAGTFLHGSAVEQNNGSGFCGLGLPGAPVCRRLDRFGVAQPVRGELCMPRRAFQACPDIAVSPWCRLCGRPSVFFLLPCDWSVFVPVGTNAGAGGRCRPFALVQTGAEARLLPLLRLATGGAGSDHVFRCGGRGEGIIVTFCFIYVAAQQLRLPF